MISSNAKHEIYKQIDSVVQKSLHRVSERSEKHSGNPFILALLKDFESLVHVIHGLKTSLGNEMEKIAEIIARDAWGVENVARNRKVNVILPKNIFQTIDTIINNLSNAKTLSDYQKEKQAIFDACKNPSTEKEQYTYIFDLVIKNVENEHVSILEMKGPEPNTTEVSGAKKRLLVACAWAYLENRSDNVDCRLAIYYNNKFPKAYKNPKVHYYFNPNGGTLVQDEFWNFIGKSDQTFHELKEIFEHYGNLNKKKIWNSFSQLLNKS